MKETLEDVTEVKDITIDNEKKEEDKETKDEGETEIKEQIKEQETKGSAGNPVKVSIYRLIYTVLWYQGFIQEDGTQNNIFGLVLALYPDS